MKKILIYIACTILALSTVSCAKVGFSGPEVPGDGVTLQFLASSLTKAEVAGADNENLVNKIDWFIFPFKEDGSAVDSTAKALLNGTISPTDKLAESYTETLDATAINKAFPTADSRALVFAVANYTGNYETDVTLNNLLEIEVRSTFADADRWPHPLATDNADLYFVMTGSAEIVLTEAPTQVPLNRLASKVTVEFTFVDSVVDAHDANVIWKPQYEGDEARVYLSNAIATATLGGSLTRDYVKDSDATWKAGTRDIFEYSYDYLKDLAAAKKVPTYYTYPASMEAGDDNQPYLKLVLPWYAYEKNNPNGAPIKQKEVYYKIALPLDALQESNRLYEYKVNVNIIGSDTEVEIGATYTVKDWFNEGDISSNLATGKYISLDIPKDEYDMYSETVEILYVASGDVEISNLQIYKNDFKAGSKMFYINGNPADDSAFIQPKTTEDANHTTLPNWATVDEDSHKLLINHYLNTDINSSAVDISPYYFVITLHLVDDTDGTFDRTVTITQYPPIYVETDETTNTNTVWLNGIRYGAAGSGDVRTKPNGNQIGQIGGGSGTTSNDKIIITVTTLASLNTDRYTQLGVGTPVIGDPRVVLSSNYPTNPYDASQVWKADDYSTDIGDYRYAGVDKQNVIAPRIMIASGRGGNPGTKRYWLYAGPQRCAAYQEDGYPAGRWRTPTEAEILFISTLAKERQLIPDPFYSTGYWSNSGRAYYNGGSNNYVFGSSLDHERSVRCVYDLWYWGDQPYGNDHQQIPDGATTDPATEWLGFMTSK